MIAKLIQQEGGRRTFELHFGQGERITDELMGFLKKRKLLASTFRARGEVRNLTVGSVDPSGKSMKKNRFDGVLEILAMEGEIMIRNGNAEIDARVMAGRPDGTVCGGKFLEAASAELEVVLTESPRLPRAAGHQPFPDFFYDNGQSPLSNDLKRRTA